MFDYPCMLLFKANSGSGWWDLKQASEVLTVAAKEEVRRGPLPMCLGMRLGSCMGQDRATGCNWDIDPHRVGEVADTFMEKKGNTGEESAGGQWAYQLCKGILCLLYGIQQGLNSIHSLGMSLECGITHHPHSPLRSFNKSPSLAMLIFCWVLRCLKMFKEWLLFHETHELLFSYV